MQPTPLPTMMAAMAMGAMIRMNQRKWEAADKRRGVREMLVIVLDELQARGVEEEAEEAEAWRKVQDTLEEAELEFRLLTLTLNS